MSKELSTTITTIIHTLCFMTIIVFSVSHSILTELKILLLLRISWATLLSRLFQILFCFWRSSTQHISINKSFLAFHLWFIIQNHTSNFILDYVITLLVWPSSFRFFLWLGLIVLNFGPFYASCIVFSLLKSLRGSYISLTENFCYIHFGKRIIHIAHFCLISMMGYC